MGENILPLLTAHSVRATTVVACFVNIVGFPGWANGPTDRDYVAQILEVFYSSLNEAFDETGNNLSAGTEFCNRIKAALPPAVKRVTGNGVMLIWEIPANYDTLVRIAFNICVLDFVQLLQTFFYESKPVLKGRFPHKADAITPLDISIGIGYGDAWKLMAPGGGPTEFIGRPISMALRLQMEASPFGVVSPFDLLPNLFLERMSIIKEGIIDVVTLGEGKEKESIEVWKAIQSQVLHRRRSRDASSFDKAMASMMPMDTGEEPHESPLSPDDTKDIFQLRSAFEVQFVHDLTERWIGEQVTDTQLESLNPQIRDKFHEGIARLSADNIAEGNRRSQFVDWAYNNTREVNQHAPIDSPEEVRRQHAAIFEAIKTKKTGLAKRLMERHLNDSSTEGKMELLRRARANGDNY